jgi:hypothetical protein
MISGVITAVMGIQRSLVDLVEALVELEANYTGLQVSTALCQENIDTINKQLEELKATKGKTSSK